MTLENFTEELIKHVKLENLDKQVRVEYFETLKNNGVKYPSIIIKSNGKNISPVIHVEQFYNEYTNEELTMDDILRIINEIIDSTPSVTVDFSDFELLKNHIYPILVNTDRNRSLLSTIPHKDFLDLSVIYRFFIPSIEEPVFSIGESASSIISNGIIEKWNISETELEEIAINNLKKSKITFRNIFEFLKSLIPEEIKSLIPEEINIDALDKMKEDSFMYVLHSETPSYGANAILLNSELEKIFAKLGSFYIFPSSIHECMIAPVSKIPSAKEAKSVILQVNGDPDCIPPEDILSNTLYQYDGNDIKIVG